MRRKGGKKNPFDPNYAPYGTCEGRGSPEEWRASFSEAWERTATEKILGDDSPWGVLGLKPGAGMDEVRRAFRSLVRKSHPDMFPEAERAAATERTRRIIAAYSVLGGK